MMHSADYIYPYRSRKRWTQPKPQTDEQLEKQRRYDRKKKMRARYSDERSLDAKIRLTEDLLVILKEIQQER